MKNRRIVIFSTVLCMTAAILSGCSEKNQVQESSATTEAPVLESTSEPESSSAASEEKEAELEDGVYSAKFDTDSSMFHVNEACDGRGTLTVKDGEMTIHISLQSQKILNLYSGLAEDAAKDGADLLQPTTDTVTYSDGTTEEVYGFDVPVPALDEEFDLALIGTKGTWYDHKVSVSDPQPIEEETKSTSASLEDGTYSVEFTMEGGSGRAYIVSPATVTVSGGVMTATLEWSSENYDYMIVNDEKYLPVNTEGNSVFEVPVSALDEPLVMIGDTVAMSQPHEIEYTLTFHSDTVVAAEN